MVSVIGQPYASQDISTAHRAYVAMIDKAALQVTIKALLSVPQGDGSVHLIRGHMDLTQRKAGRLMDICYKSESDAGRWAYGQV